MRALNAREAWGDGHAMEISMSAFDPHRLTRPLSLERRVDLARFLTRRARRPATLATWCFSIS